MDERTDLSKGLPLEVAGSTSEDVGQKLLFQAMTAVPPRSSNQVDRGNHSVAIVDMIKELGPCDVIEGMLAVQITAVQDTIMDCLTRGMQATDDKVRDQNLRNANRLIGQFIALANVFEKRKERDRKLRILPPGTIRPETEEDKLRRALYAEIARGFMEEAREEDEARDDDEIGEEDETDDEFDTPPSHASKPQVRRPNTERQSVPSARRSGPEAVPDARLRPGKRRPEG